MTTKTKTNAEQSEDVIYIADLQNWKGIMVSVRIHLNIKRILALPTDIRYKKLSLPADRKVGAPVHQPAARCGTLFTGLSWHRYPLAVVSIVTQSAQFWLVPGTGNFIF